MQKVELHQIFYDAESAALLAPEARPLDNTDGPPDWFEFWPILCYLRQNDLRDDTLYGFVSPQFVRKTGVTVREAISFAQQQEDAQVLLYSSQWMMRHFFLNPWLQGEYHHPGLIERASEFFDAIGQSVDLSHYVSDNSTSVTSNYMIADRSFWLSWRELAEEYFDFVQNSSAGKRHEDATSYLDKSGYPFKVFIQERLACHVLRQGFRTVVPPMPVLPGYRSLDQGDLSRHLARLEETKLAYGASRSSIDSIRYRVARIAFSSFLSSEPLLKRVLRRMISSKRSF
ncbi:hypothetical protein [Roseobacter sp. AzwK-3b]|uniref:hypothetical protein n=1 Tax=Roseobacter sp. AzwK-3b TaxID=351016 RepID=UPI0012F4ABEE|nr:hypothetical protein [Roseobacter sp. AzwK-3b]